MNNIDTPPPKWFRKAKKATLVLTLSANAMIASWGFEDALQAARLQLWCTMGIGAVLEALEALLADPDYKPSDQPKD